MAPLPEVNGCRWCAVPKRGHMQRFTPPSKGGPGWHQWTPPTDEQRLARMTARRTARKATR